MQSARTIIEHLLAKGKLEAAIEGSLILCRHEKDMDRQGIISLQSARFHTLMDDYDAGMVGDDDYRIERAKINRAMLEFAQAIPAVWTDAGLEAADFSAARFDTRRGPGQKGLKWGWVAGVAVVLLLLAGVLLRDKLFPAQASDVQPTVATKPGAPAVKTDTIAQQTTPDNSKTPAGNQPIKPANTRTVPKTQEQPTHNTLPENRPGSLATSDERFRSFSKSVIAEGMERGYVGNKLAFRNVQTKEMLCCFSDAEDFSHGKAYVSKDGVNYYYIDKNGKRVD